MGGWGISNNATPKEKKKAEMADFLHGLNATGQIDIEIYDEMFDYSRNLLDEMYELGKKYNPQERVNQSTSSNDDEEAINLEIVKRMKYAIHVLEEEIEERKNALSDLDDNKEKIFGAEQVEKVRKRIKGQVKELKKAIEILEEIE